MHVRNLSAFYTTPSLRVLIQLATAKIENDGSYTWTPSNSLTRGTDYSIEIVSDSDPSVVNYTPYFTLDTTTTEATTTSKVTLGASSTAASPSETTASPLVPIHNTFTHATTGDKSKLGIQCPVLRFDFAKKKCS